MRSSIVIKDQDVLDFAWRGLRNFHNVEYCKNKIVKLHGVPKKQYKNVEKQALQIRYCLMQAQEYFSASRSVGLGTRPLLLYYSCMSLALAQILFRGTGINSLENTRGQNAHHGLSFKIDGDISGVNATSVGSIENLRTAPVISSGKRIGTFELWQSLSFELPLVGKEIDNRGGAALTTLGNVLMSSDGSRQWELPPKGVNLLEIFRNAPGMVDWFNQQGSQSNIVRGRIQRTIGDSSAVLALVIHPSDKSVLDRLAQSFLFQPSVIPDLSIQDYKSGFAISVDVMKISGSFEFPQGYMWRVDEVRFPDPEFKLNIFGLNYAGLHILGNLARYFPEVWMRHIEAHTPLASGAEVFLDLAAVEITLTTLSVLSDLIYVPSSR